eukprot:SAG22_NODE_8114_length_682_cov_0.466552_1_plen_79_part_10
MSPPQGAYGSVELTSILAVLFRYPCLQSDFLEVFESLGGSSRQDIFEQIDADGDGEVTFAEFKAALKGYRSRALQSEHP